MILIIDLSCNEQNSNKMRNYLQKDKNSHDKAVEFGNFEVVSTLIFHNYDLQNQNKNIIANLIVSDEWDDPIDKNVANILYFALLVNCDKETKMKITNFTQAQMLFDLFENDYTKLHDKEETNKMRFETFETSEYPCIFPDTKLIFSIPVRFYLNKKDGEHKRGMGFQGYFKFQADNEEPFQVSYNMLKPFFTNSLNKKGQLLLEVGQKEKIASRFEYNKKALYDLLYYLGYHNNKAHNDIFELPIDILLMKDNKLVSMNRNANFKYNSLWKDVNGRKVLLPNKNYILFERNRDDYIILER